MNVFIDIETIPCQTNFDEYLEKELADFKAPSSLTKAQACADLGLSGSDAKYKSKDDAIAEWQEKFAAEKAPEVAEEKWRKTSFDGGCGEVISVAWAVEDGKIKSKIRALDDSEGDFLKSVLDEILEDSHKEVGGTKYPNKPFLIGHYISGFDLKFLFHRCVVLGVEPPFKIPFAGRHDKDYYDTMIAWAGYKDKVSQDNLCKALGIEGKPNDIDGSKVWDYIKAGKYSEVEEYNRDDVKKVRLIFNRLNFKGA